MSTEKSFQSFLFTHRTITTSTMLNLLPFALCIKVLPFRLRYNTICVHVNLLISTFQRDILAIHARVCRWKRLRCVISRVARVPGSMSQLCAACYLRLACGCALRVAFAYCRLCRVCALWLRVAFACCISVLHLRVAFNEQQKKMVHVLCRAIN